MMFAKQQELMVRVINLFAEQFEKRAVLRGGMVLRVLGCERLTNDLDYIFVPYESKKEIVDEVLKTLSRIDGAKTEHSLNSKCLRVIVTVGAVSVQIEAKVAIQVPAQVLSTREIAKEYNLPPRLISVLDYPEALAHKMAAWNERRLIRDVYDIWFYLRLGVVPDAEILKARLKKPSYSRLVGPKDHFQGEGVKEFYEFFLLHVFRLSDQQIMEALENSIDKSDLAGMAMKFRTECVRLREMASDHGVHSGV
jgi:hypothetical protein